MKKLHSTRRWHRSTSSPPAPTTPYSLYVAREAIANVHGGNFASVRIAVFNGNEDDPASAFGYCYLYGGKYSSKGVNQSGEDFTLPDGYIYVPLTDEDPYKWEVVKG